MKRILADAVRAIQSRPGGATDNEIAEFLGINLRTANERRIALQRQGLVAYCGMQATGMKTKRTMWELTNTEVVT
jgi:Mn-dependent DtxR family transcriptional regulator